MKYLELKLELEEAMECEESKSKVYELYQRFEEAYRKETSHKKDNQDRIDIYFKFIDYINRNKK